LGHSGQLSCARLRRQKIDPVLGNTDQIQSDPVLLARWATENADLNYQGYVAHEFVPTRPDPFASLAEAFQVCTV